MLFREVDRNLCLFGLTLARGGNDLLDFSRLAVDGTEIRAEFRFNSAILADMAIRGCAISFLVSARVVISSLVCFLLPKIVPGWLGEKSISVPFRTVAAFFHRCFDY